MPSDGVRDSEHNLKHRRFPLNIRKHFFTVTQAAQRGCGVSLRRDIKKPSLHGPVQPALGGPA